jgi:sorbitol-6-phosphate 2-dehydrogenase
VVGVSKVLQGKVAIVTGGGQGLGEALCRRLAEEGCSIVVADLNEETAAETAADISAYLQSEGDGGRAIAVKTDVTKEDQVAAMVDRAVEEFGRVDILVSNAGILISGEIDAFPVQKWRAVVEVNLVGYFLCAKHVARVMKEQRSGVIVQINSKSGKKGSYKNSAYAASKFGGIGLTQSLALELAEYGVRVNAVCPGNLLDSPLWVDSLYAQYAEKWGITEEEVRQKYVDQVPMKRGCTYQDVTNVVAFLASDQSSYVTGQAINVTGGQEMH